ncbi:MAG: hypothetical protein CLLPBCKN_004891 [Chroococcidiopsis cubana SAG 39.79]|uniref:hypothetical protein n=1 Tax=Chroococcidiopsis cubana TaxID=171392 RepID=UPI000D06632D|nr:hypothetical protein [Chroococcidiopsis cubana]MDZ4875495.1 hypothetical protein [Chroococcidiopsis cubana SAG 39.79]PSB64150.1 hypothetical protein C7B79_10950 [Chroococcidiopsis cubana CCALA 043]
MKQGINSRHLPHQHRAIRSQSYNQVSKETLAAADKAILVMRLKDALKHNKFVPISVITSLTDADCKISQTSAGNSHPTSAPYSHQVRQVILS